MLVDPGVQPVLFCRNPFLKSHMGGPMGRLAELITGFPAKREVIQDSEPQKIIDWWAGQCDRLLFQHFCSFNYADLTAKIKTKTILLMDKIQLTDTYPIHSGLPTPQKSCRTSSISSSVINMMIFVFHVNATSNRQSPFATTQVLVVPVWCGWWEHHLQHYMVGWLNSWVLDAEYNYNGLCTLKGQIVFGRKTCQKIVRNMDESSLQHYSQITFQVEFCPRHPDRDILVLKRLMHEFWTIYFKRIMFLQVLIGLFLPGSMTSRENLSHVEVLHFIIKWSSFPRDWFLDSIFNCRFFSPFFSQNPLSYHLMSCVNCTW